MKRKELSAKKTGEDSMEHRPSDTAMAQSYLLANIPEN
jgi:hypothetical protein